MRNQTSMIIVVLFLATAAAGQQATTPVTTPTPMGDLRKVESTPPTDDAVVVAAQRAAQMQDQAAKAAAQAVETATHGGPLFQAQRHLLMAAALLYTSSAQLERVAQKESARATRWNTLGEQKTRAAEDLDDAKVQTAERQKSKAYLAYAKTQAAIAQSMLDFAQQQEDLAKEADAAAKASVSEPLETSAQHIVEQNEAAQALAATVLEMRTKLATQTP